MHQLAVGSIHNPSHIHTYIYIYHQHSVRKSIHQPQLMPGSVRASSAPVKFVQASSRTLDDNRRQIHIYRQLPKNPSRRTSWLREQTSQDIMRSETNDAKHSFQLAQEHCAYRQCCSLGLNDQELNQQQSPAFTRKELMFVPYSFATTAHTVPRARACLFTPSGTQDGPQQIRSTVPWGPRIAMDV